MASGTKKPQHFIDELKLPLWKPDRGNVSVGEALFEMRLLSRIAGARKDGVMVREGVGANILGDLGKGLDGAVVAQAATKEEKAETGVEAFKSFGMGRS